MWKQSNSSFALRLGQGAALTAMLALGSLVPCATAQDGGRPDQVYLIDSRGEAKTVSCVVETDGLDKVVADQKGRPRNYDASSITRVVFGKITPAFRDAMGYADAGDLDNAVRKFRVAADDADARQPVRASARFRAATSLMAAAAKDSANTEWKSVVAEFDRFLSDYPSNRQVPTARRSQARARLLAGEAQLAAELGAAILGDLDSSGKNAYTLSLCLEAGLESARAFLSAGDVARARTLFTDIERAAGAARTDASDETIAMLAIFQERALLGEGWALLAEDKATQAATFFAGKLRAETSSAVKFSARLGQAEALLAQGKHRQAQFEFAAVSALDYSSRDNVAQALSGLIRCASALPDTDSTERIATWKEAILTHYGDTPAALTVQ
ncbi:MAG: hypothetical protein ACI84E_000423 [Planctomycetota bacterium]|jgi:hypothetical protein